jgi:hypothetical protein
MPCELGNSFSTKFGGISTSFVFSRDPIVDGDGSIHIQRNIRRSIPSQSRFIISIQHAFEVGQLLNSLTINIPAVFDVFRA